VLALRQGFRVVEVKVRHREERGRRGFFGIGVYLRRLLDILAITFLTRFTQKPLRFFGMIGLVLMLVGLLLSIEPLLSKFAGGSIAERPIIVLSTVLIAIGIQLIGFGLVGEIIIFTQARNLRDFKIDEVVEHDSSLFIPAAEASVRNGVPLRVRELVPGEDARWDARVRQFEGSTFFHQTGWRKVVEDIFRHEPHYVVAEQGGRWVGLLPMFLTKSPFLGTNLVSVPYAVYGGMLVEGREAADALVQYAETFGKRAGIGYLELRHQRRVLPQWPSSDLYVTFRKSLAADSAAILAAIPKKARAEVRRARDKHQLRFEESDDLRAFFGLFRANKRRLGSPSPPLAWFEALRDEFGRQVVLHTVSLPSGEAIASVMSFCFKDTVSAYYSGALHAHYGTGVNDFIYFKIMEWAVEHGFRVFDFGRSRKETGAAQFKSNMGFDAEPLNYEYVMIEEGARMPEFHPSNPRLDLPRRVWSHLPEFLTARLGARLSKYLP
jgi:FemAB-related protein (PEP-CTERM system-associated)